MQETLNILIIEQNQEELKQLFNWLNEEPNYNLLSVATSEMALVVMQKKTLDLLIIDWDTVLSAKVDLFKHLTQNKQFNKIPRIISSTTSQLAKDREYIEKCSTHILTKPLKVKSLQDEVSNILENLNNNNKAQHSLQDSSVSADSLQKELEKAQQTILKQQKMIRELEKSSSSGQDSVNGVQLKTDLDQKRKALEDFQEKYEQSKKELSKTQEVLRKQKESYRDTMETLISLKEKLKSQERLQNKIDVLEEEQKSWQKQNASNLPSEQGLIQYLLPLAWRGKFEQDSDVNIKLSEKVNLLLFTIDNYLLVKQQQSQALEKWEQDFSKQFNALCEQKQTQAIRSQNGVFMAISKHLPNYGASAEQLVELAQSCQTITKDLSQGLTKLQVNISLHSGSLLVGQINTQPIVYDHWGSLTQKLPRPKATKSNLNTILLSQFFRQLLPEDFSAELVGKYKDRQFGLLNLYQLSLS